MSTPAVEDTADNAIHVRVDGETLGWLVGRAERSGARSRHAQAGRDLALLRRLLAAELGQVELTMEEAAYLSAAVLAMVGTNPGLTLGSVLYVAVVRFGASAKGKRLVGPLDLVALTDKMDRLSTAADYALHDGMCRWLTDPDRELTVESFKAAGITITEDAE